MRHNKFISLLFGAALVAGFNTSCEDDDIYSVNAPDWITAKADSIAAAKASATETEESIEGLMEDVYTIGESDFSTGFWVDFSKYYVVPDGEVWYAQFNLSISTEYELAYKNFGLVIATDTRDGANYKEYGVIRYDTRDDSAYNSLWGDSIYFKYVSSTLEWTNGDEVSNSDLQKLAGKVTVKVDRTDNQFNVTFSNTNDVVKTYSYPYPLGKGNDMYFFVTVENAYITWSGTTIEPIGGLTSAEDKEPISMVLNNVPETIKKGFTDEQLDSLLSGVTATVTYEENATAEVTADDLTFQSIPSIEEEGTKTLVAVYAKTYKGEAAATPIIASAEFKVVTEIESIEVTTLPSVVDYLLYKSPTGSMTVPFNTTDLVVTATYSNGDQATVDLSELTFSTVGVDTKEVTITTDNGKTATVAVNVTVKDISGYDITTLYMTPTILGAEDNSSGWWALRADNQQLELGKAYVVNFTNYTSGAGNWNNWVAILRNGTDDDGDSYEDSTGVTYVEYVVARSDNYGWGTGYSSATLSGGQSDWAVWLAAMDGAEVTLYVIVSEDGTANLYAEMLGNDGVTYYQYYDGITVADPLYLSFTVDASHYVFLTEE